MSHVEWYVEGVQFSNCNCTYACPCQFELVPSHGHCIGFEVSAIERGHFANVTLDDLRFAVSYAWPGPIYDGQGELQAVIDVHATVPQREALQSILMGEETEEAATHWWVFRAMADKVHETLYEPIELEVNLDARTARAVIPGILEASGRPIVSPATGQPHRVRIDIPQGIEFEQAEIGSASATGTGAIRFALSDSYGQFSRLRHSNKGVVHA
jgi:hypothetical protein